MSESTDGVSSASRRDVLKASGAAAVGLATFLAAANAVGETVAGASVVDRTTVTHYPTSISMSIGGVSLGRVRSVTPSTRSVEVTASVDSNNVRRFDRGNSNAVAVSVSRLFDGDTTLQKWFAGSSSGTPGGALANKQTVTLTLLGRRQSSLGVLELVNAWPSSYSAPGWQVPQNTALVVKESVTLVAETMTYKSA